MKKFLIFLLVAAVVVVGGGWFVKQKMTNVVANRITREASTPAGEQSIKKILSSPQVKSALSKYDSNGPHFATQQQAIKYAASKLSPTDMAKLANAYAHRNSLTGQQEAQLKQELLSKFTPQQLAAMAQPFSK